MREYIKFEKMLNKNKEKWNKNSNGTRSFAKINFVNGFEWLIREFIFVGFSKFSDWMICLSSLCVSSNKMIWYARAVQLLTRAKIIIHSCNERDYNIMKIGAMKVVDSKIFSSNDSVWQMQIKRQRIEGEKGKKRKLLTAFVLIVYRLHKFKSSRINAVIKW